VGEKRAGDPHVERPVPFALIALLLSLFLLIGSHFQSETAYAQFAERVASCPRAFSTFRRHFLSRCKKSSVQEGRKYKKRIAVKYPDLLREKALLQGDLVGGPLLHRYHSIGLASSERLKALYFGAEIRRLFPNVSKMHLLQTNVDYGSQCKALYDFSITSGIHPSFCFLEGKADALITKTYLDSVGIKNISFTNDIEDLASYDLCIGETSSQNGRLLAQVPRGYLRCYSEGPFAFEGALQTLLQKDARGVLELGSEEACLYWSSEAPVPPSPCTAPVTTGSAVTYELSGGRLGDSLIAYLHARWIAYRTGLPLLRVPFKEDSLFSLHDLDPVVDSRPFREVKQVTHLSEIDPSAPSTLYVIPYFSECLYERRNHAPLFEVNWEDPFFQREVIRCLTPKQSVESFPLPVGNITVGVHVRRGGDKDTASAVTMFPLKFPPDEYYLEQIERILHLYKGQSFYIHLFTDDPDPAGLALRYQNSISNPNVTFGFREQASFLDDFCALSHFDCLILPQSHFSIVASKLGRHSLLILPTHGKKQQNSFSIDKIEMQFRSCKL
jgi:hypothetical protein